jgi:hypothetical protein
MEHSDDTPLIKVCTPVRLREEIFYEVRSHNCIDGKRASLSKGLIYEAERVYLETNGSWTVELRGLKEWKFSALVFRNVSLSELVGH